MSRGGPVALAVAAGCIGATALLGPSAAEPALGGHDGTTPPFHLGAHPAPWVVTLLPALAVAAGVLALLLVLSGRWRPPPRRLALAAAAVVGVLALLPPVGSADPLSYASYGRMVVTGHDPYTTAPAELAGTDRVAAAVEPPWKHEPSVYGPLATGEQAAVAAVAGDDPARAVWVLGLIGAAAFLAVGVLLDRVAGDDDGRRRAAALWTANPLLWLTVVAGAHLDVLVAAGALGAVVLGARRRPVAGAAVAGVAAALKPPGGLVWLAVAWPLRRRPGRVVAAALVAAAVVVAAYAAVTPAAERQLSRAARRVSHATPWRPLLEWTHAPRGLLGLLALVLAAVLAVLLARRHGGEIPVPLVAVAVTLAYVLAAPYALPWYDAVPWAVLPLAAASWRDRVLVAHTSVLALAYLPGRDAVALHGALRGTTAAMRDVVAPALLAAVLVAVVVVAVSGRAGRPGSGRSRAGP